MSSKKNTKNPPKKDAPKEDTGNDAGHTDAELHLAYWTGWQDAVRESGWVCGDCGNTYDAGVDECPNNLLDEAVVATRSAQWAKEIEGETASDDESTP